MKEIVILDDYPAILTKDKDFVAYPQLIEPGSIILLPEDAVLVNIPVTVSEELLG